MRKRAGRRPRNMKGLTYVRMFGPRVILIAGNWQDDAFPPSTLGGGRIQSVCSSVMDTTRILLVSNVEQQHSASTSDATDAGRRAEDMLSAFVKGRQPKRLKADKLWNTIESSEVRDTVAMREIADTMVEQNVKNVRY